MSAGDVWLIAEMWGCDDEQDGYCYQPKIRKVTEREHPLVPLQELIWEGTFINTPEEGEMEKLEAELREAAAQYGVQLEDSDQFGPTWPHGRLALPRN